MSHDQHVAHPVQVVVGGSKATLTVRTNDLRVVVFRSPMRRKVVLPFHAIVNLWRERNVVFVRVAARPRRCGGCCGRRQGGIREVAMVLRPPLGDDEEAMDGLVATLRHKACLHPQGSQGRHLVLLNPKSGSGKSHGVFMSQVGPMLDAAAIRYEVVLTRYPRHATEIASQLEDGQYSRIIVCGGDGFIGEVVNGNVHALNLPLCVVPTGSDNSTCASLGMWSVWDAALAIVKGTPQEVDLGVLEFVPRAGTSPSIELRAVAPHTPRTQAEERMEEGGGEEGEEEGREEEREDGNGAPTQRLWFHSICAYGIMGQAAADLQQARWMGPIRTVVVGLALVCQSVKSRRVRLRWVPSSPPSPTTPPCTPPFSSAASPAPLVRRPSVEFDRTRTLHVRIVNVALGPGPGKTMAAPHGGLFTFGDYSDGALDMVYVRHCSWCTLLQSAYGVGLDGHSHMRLREVNNEKVNRVWLDLPVEPPLNVDGEVVRLAGNSTQRVAVRVVPRGAWFVAPVPAALAGERSRRLPLPSWGARNNDEDEVPLMDL